MAIHDLGDGVKLYTRDEWAHGLGERGNGTPRALTDITEFYAHHSGGLTLGDPDPAQWIRNIYHEHVFVRGYVDIAYEAVVDEHGGLWECRRSTIASAATLGHNLHGYATCLLRAKGDAEKDHIVPDACKNAFRKNYQLTQYLVSVAGGIPLAQRVHRDVFATDCPGDDLADWVHGHGLAVPFAAPKPAPKPKPKPAPAPKPGVRPPWPSFPGTALALGSTGDAVRAWQDRMDLMGGHLGVDGAFGSATAQVTREFQASHGLTPDGVVGPLTWAAAGS